MNVGLTSKTLMPDGTVRCRGHAQTRLRIPRSNRLAAFSLPELMLAVFIFTTLIMGGTALMHISTVQFQDTVYSSYSESDLNLTVRRIRSELSQACSITITSGGTGIQYQCFSTNADGSFRTDPTTSKPVVDSTVHTLEMRHPSGNSTRYSLYWDQAAGGLSGRPIVQNISLSDPNPETAGAPTYTPFSLESGATNVVRLKLIVSPQYGTPGAGVRSASQRVVTDVTCRNIP